MPVVMKNMRLRERCGTHIEAHPDDPTKEVVVLPGQVFRAPEHRAQRWPEKFELMPDAMPVSPDLHVRGRNGEGPLPEPPVPRTKEQKLADASRAADKDRDDAAKTLEAMTVDQLKQHAAAEDIDVSACRTKADLVKTITAAM